ncbi:MAG: GNAT family N-acetyltransferase [Prevotellaceae bacterium]|jgi:ribosomal protein S18 acetylase RimI-like enzyme|nr:GNAT family N-acetyltransferase [Prevotellaceae bacterium]
MELRIESETENISWEQVVEVLRKAGMATRSVEIHKRAFNNSHSSIFVFDDEILVGCGRMISDGAYQSALYDIAVLPEYQGRGIGKPIVQNLLKQTPNCNFILYASPGKEKFYEKENFKKMKTGMALFVNGEIMREKGFTE